MLPCFTPHIKFGIYRPGNKNGNKLSIIDFDKINVNVEVVSDQKKLKMSEESEKGHLFLKGV